METLSIKKERNSNIELFRIITMILIVAHHYVANSGIIQEIVNGKSITSFRSLFLLVFGWGGKTGINCFVLITGYYMCKSKITLKKFLKLFLEREFYAIVFFLIFLITGYTDFSIVSFVKVLLPIFSIGKGFTTAYILFFCFIPFLNMLIEKMSRKQHLYLILLCLFMYTILPSFCLTEIMYNYVTWFAIIYFIGAYIRLYPNKVFDSAKITGILALVSLILSWLSVIACSYGIDMLGDSLVSKLGAKFGLVNLPYFFVHDSNKILALITAVVAFLFFKNINLGHSKFINTVAASCFGVLLIHSNSSAMRQWLWVDTFKCVENMYTGYFVIHAVLTVAIVYSVCTLIDILRIKFIEKPFFKYADKHIDKITEKYKNFELKLFNINE